MVLPAFGDIPSLTFDMTKIREAESRIIEAKTVNPITYADLESCYNESYRDLKRYLSSVGYQITLTEKAMEMAKADILLDKYPEFMKDRPKTSDNADLRKAFMMKDDNYVAALDRLNMLKAVESNFDGKIKVMERTCAYMKKEIDLILRSGLSNKDLYLNNKK